MNIILKITIVTSKNGSKNSQVKHIPLGQKIILGPNQAIETISFDDVKFIYNKKDSKND